MNLAHREPVATRRQEHRASRRGPCAPTAIEPSQGFRLLCALIRKELVAHPRLNFGDGYVDLVEHMKTAAAKAHVQYGGDRLTRALDAVESSIRRRTPAGSVVREHTWRDRCAHTPRCTLPVHCALKTVREAR